MNVKLKPCPFCGGDASFSDSDDEMKVVIGCGSCDVIWHCNGYDEAINAWNTRAGETALTSVDQNVMNAFKDPRFVVIKVETFPNIKDRYTFDIYGPDGGFSIKGITNVDVQYSGWTTGGDS